MLTKRKGLIPSANTQNTVVHRQRNRVKSKKQNEISSEKNSYSEGHAFAYLLVRAQNVNNHCSRYRSRTQFLFPRGLARHE